jgi:peptide/nickel transport system substrate-binding protein
VRASRLLTIAAASALALTACSGGKAVDTGSGTSGSSSSSGGKTLVAAVSARPDQFDPHKTSAYPSFQVLENVYDTLVVPNPTNLKMEPSLATKWTTSSDNLTWTFTLRDGVTFHDGSTFDSQDVVYSYKRIIGEKLANSYRFANVKDVTAPDPKTVVITLTKPTPNLLALIGAFKGMAILPDGAEKKMDLTKQTDGTGPFQLVSSDATHTVLKAYPKYWGGAPKIGGVDFRYITEPAAALTALKNGEIQWTDNIPPQQIDSLRSDSSIHLESTASVDYWYMSMNYAHKPFDNPLLRKAIATAVDRDAVTKAAKFSAARSNETAIPKDSFYYYDYKPFTPDVNKAKALVAQSGVKTPLTMELMVTSEFPESVTAAQVIASELKPIGINVKIDTLDFATWLDREAKGQMDAFMLSWLGNIDPADFYEQQHLTGGSSNYQKYSNPKVDALLKQGAVEVDQTKRKALYDQAAKMIVDDVSYLYLYNPDVVQAWSPNLKGYQIRADRAINFEDVTLP